MICLVAKVAKTFGQSQPAETLGEFRYRCVITVIKRIDGQRVPDNLEIVL